MVVEFENMLEGCPESCPHASIGIDHEVVSCEGSAVKVYATVFCDHLAVCRLREEASDGE